MKSHFPYMIGVSGNLYDGDLFPVPEFCKSNLRNRKCRDFYASLENDKSLHKCPYGFSSYKVEIGGELIVLTCLNIETVSDKKEVIRRLRSNDWSPRISRNVFENAVRSLTDKTNSLELAQKEFDQKRFYFEQDIQVFNETLHEVRKINNQLKSSSEQLSNSLRDLNEELTKEIDDIRKNLLANCDLLSIRLNAYDMVVNPSLHENALRIDIPIYRYVEKVYKCLHNFRVKKKVIVNMVGTSTAIYKACSIIEVGLYIIIENAIKYSPEGLNVDITFNEYGKNLEVKFQNWGPKLQPSELAHITERGYRADQVKRMGDIEGSGIGLYLLNRICDSNDIKLKINTGNDMKIISGWIYKPFIVTLGFQIA